MNTHKITYLNFDRQFAAEQLREHMTELLSAVKKDYAAIKVIYELILKEEKQDLDRREVEIAERESEQKLQLQLDEHTRPVESKKPAILPVAEIKRRVRVLLGKECPQ
jgi:hypothetical protein